MRPVRGLAVRVGVTVGLLASCCALASAPPVLDRVPAGAMVVIAVPSPNQLHKDLQSLTTAIEVPVPIPGVEELLQQWGIDKGVDSGKAVAIAVMPPKQDEAAKEKADAPADDEDAPPKKMDEIIFLVPVTNYADLLSNFAAKPSGGVDAGKLRDEETFFKDLGGGYAAMSPKKELLDNFKPGGGAALKEAMGTVGEQIFSTSSVVAIINMEVVRPLGPGALKAVEDKLAEAPGGMGLAGLSELPVLSWAGETLMRDTRTVVAGFKPDAMGIGMDIAVRFNDGSYMAKAMTGRGAASQVLARLPNQPFLFTFAMDLATPGMRTIIDDVSNKLGAGPEGKDALPPVFTLPFRATEGATLLFGTPPGGLLGGILTSTVGYWKTKSPDKYIQAMRQALEEMNGKAENGFTYQTSYEVGASEVNGVKVDTWSVKLEASDEDAGQAAMAMAAIFGPAGGPGGFIAKVEDGVIQTYSKNSLLLGAALEAAKKGDNLSKDKLLAQVAERLPRDRVGEAYLGVKSILEQFIAIAPMAGVQLDIEVPATLPPIGIGLGTEEGGARFGVYLPAPVIKTIAAVAMQAQQGGGMGIPRGGGKKDDKNGAGQPRF